MKLKPLYHFLNDQIHGVKLRRLPGQRGYEPRPVHVLKGFTRVYLQPGESKIVSFQIKQEDLACWDPENK